MQVNIWNMPESQCQEESELSDYEAYCYMMRYQDLINAWKNNPDPICKAKVHWKNNGINEGRTASCEYFELYILGLFTSDDNQYYVNILEEGPLKINFNTCGHETITAGNSNHRVVI